MEIKSYTFEFKMTVIKFYYENTVKWGKINQKHAFLQRRPCDICAFCAKLV